MSEKANFYMLFLLRAVAPGYFGETSVIVDDVPEIFKDKVCVSKDLAVVSKYLEKKYDVSLEDLDAFMLNISYATTSNIYVAEDVNIFEYPRVLNAEIVKQVAIHTSELDLPMPFEIPKIIWDPEDLWLIIRAIRDKSLKEHIVGIYHMFRSGYEHKAPYFVAIY